MVSTLTWVLAGVLVYTLAAVVLKTRGVVPEYIRLQGPITTIHTKRGRAFLDRVARRHRRFWRAWGNVGIGISLVVMVGVFVAVLNAAINVLTRPTVSPVRNLSDVLVIPGVNQFLPLSAAPEIVFGLALGLVVHEGGHGLLCRVEDIEIDSMGLALFTVVPIGAFVEPSEESRDRADRGSQTRMFAAGVTNNFAVTIIAFLLLFGPIVGSVAVVAGVPVGGALPGSPAAAAGIERGDVITGVEGTPVANESELETVLADESDRTVTVSLQDGDPVEVERALVVTRALSAVLSGQPGEAGIAWNASDPPVITSVNGTRVFTERGFVAATRNRSVVRLGTDHGNATIPVGAFVGRPVDDGPLAAAGAPTDAAHVVTRFDGERIPNGSALEAALADTEPGQTVTVVAYARGQRSEYEVTLGENPRTGTGLLGVPGVQEGISGLSVDDFGIEVYPAELFLGLLGGGDGLFGGLSLDRLPRQVFAVLLMPFLSNVEPSVSFNFAGFVPVVANFYTATGPLAFLGGWVLTLANVAFWTGWINLQLGLFNCIPSFPLDGGHILRTSTEAVVSRLPVSSGRSLTTAVTVSTSLVMLVALVLMLFGPSIVP